MGLQLEEIRVSNPDAMVLLLMMKWFQIVFYDRSCLNAKDCDQSWKGNCRSCSSMIPMLPLASKRLERLLVWLVTLSADTLLDGKSLGQIPKRYRKPEEV